MLLAVLAACVILVRSCGAEPDTPADGPAHHDGGATTTGAPRVASKTPRARERAAWAEPNPSPEDADAARRIEAQRTVPFTAVVRRSEDRTPIEGATVLVADRAHREFTTDAAGRAEFLVAPGTVNFGVVATRRARQQGSLTASQGHPIAREFVLVPGAWAVGRVTDARTGAAVAGAQVIVRIGGFDGFTTYTDAGKWEVGHATTGADGEFTIQGMEPGVVFTLQATARGYVAGRRGATPYVPGAHAADLALEQGRTVRGRVVDADGTALSGIPLRCVPVGRSPVPPGPFGAGEINARTDDMGDFVLEGLARDGSYRVHALRGPSDRAPTSDAVSRGGPEPNFEVASLDVRPGSADTVVLRFERPAAVRLRVASPPGRDAGAASACLIPRDDVFDVSFDLDARAPRPVAVSPGAYRLYVDYPFEGAMTPAQRTDVVLAPGEDRVLELPWPSGVFEARVVGADGEPVRDAAGDVSVELSNEGMSFSVYADEDGRVRVDGVVPGRWHASVHLAGTERLRETVDVPGPVHSWRLVRECTARFLFPPEVAGREAVVVTDVQRGPSEDVEDGGSPWRAAETSSCRMGAAVEPIDVTIDTALPLRFRVRVDGFRTWVAELPPPNGRDVEIRVGPLVAAITVEGRVVGPDGAPVARVGLDIVDPGDPGRTASTDAAGRFRISGCAPGATTVQFSPPGRMLPRTVQLDVREGMDPVEIRLSAGGFVDVVCVTATGAPVTDLDMDVRDPHERALDWGSRSDHRGRARLRLNPGGYTIRVAGAEPVAVRVAEGSEQTVRIVVR